MLITTESPRMLLRTGFMWNVGITVCASTKISELHRLLPKYFKITRMEWYESLDPFFNRFPRAKTPKIYKISEEELSEHLRDASPLKGNGQDNL